VRLDPITVSTDRLSSLSSVNGVCANLIRALLLPNAAARHAACGQPSMPDDHSPLEPPLPIPNRTVKRRRADDSVDCPCESRSSSGTLKAKGPPMRWAFGFVRRTEGARRAKTDLPELHRCVRGSTQCVLSRCDDRLLSTDTTLCSYLSRQCQA
jgi:hypothetical protein